MPNTSRKNTNWMLCNPISIEVGRGSINGYAPNFQSIGEKTNTQINAQGSGVWQGSAFVIPIPNQLGGEVVSVRSGDYDDRLNGTGLQILHLYYLDAAGYEKKEHINLNGTVIVNSMGTNIRFITDLISHSSGVGGGASGDIILFRLGTQSVIYSQINAGFNNATSSLKMVPKGKTLYVFKTTTTVSGNKDVKVCFRSTAFNGTMHNGTTFIDFSVQHMRDSAFTQDHEPVHVFPQFSQIKVTAYDVITGAGANVSVEYDGLLIDNSVN